MIGKNSTAILFLSFILLLSCTADREKYSRLLSEAEEQNRDYTPFTSDSTMKEVVAFYDRHGSASERMKAHYLLGCVYRDLGEAPQALQCYHDATDCADTLSRDCEYELLFRVYSQMGEIFYNQEDYYDCLDSYTMASRYALKAGDSVQAIINRFLRSNAYDKMNMPDSSLRIRLEASKAFDQIHQPELSAQVLGGVFATLIEQGRLHAAANYMKKYEVASGYFNKQGEIEEGREIYYYYKGLYFLYTDSLANAYACFQKITKDTLDINNRQAYYKGCESITRKKVTSFCLLSMPTCMPMQPTLPISECPLKRCTIHRHHMYITGMSV